MDNYAPEGRLSNSSSGSADWRRRAFFIKGFATVWHRPFLGRNSMFWPSQEKIPATPVEGCRCSDSYKTLLEEQVGWHTSLVRGNGSFSKKHTDSYAYILRRKIFANCEKNFAFCKKKIWRARSVFDIYTSILDWKNCRFDQNGCIYAPICSALYAYWPK